MSFENLYKFGNKILDYFGQYFEDGDYIFLCINNEIFDNCIKEAETNIDDIYSELRKCHFDENISLACAVAIAAIQVKTFFEIKEANNDTFLEELKKLYGVNNIYSLWKNSYGQNLQELLWKITKNAFEKKNGKAFHLFTEINDIFNDNKDKVRYEDYIYLKYPITQLFFLANGCYKNELISICKNLDIKADMPFDTIYKILCLKSFRCQNISDSLRFEDTIRPDNYRRLIAFIIFIYTRTANYENDLLVDNENTVSCNVLNPILHDFEIQKYEGSWVLNIYDRGDFLEESKDDDTAFDFIRNELFDNKNEVKQIFIKQDEAEYEDADLYKLLKEVPIYSDYNKEVILLSSKDINKGILLEKNYLSKGLKLYKFSSLEECIAFCNADSDIQEKNKTISLISLFKGGIKTDRYKWLLGCEPEIPKNCSLKTFKDVPAIYRVNFDSLSNYTTLEIEESSPLSKEDFYELLKEDDIGWKIFSPLPDVTGFYLNSVNPFNFTAKRKVNKINFHGLSFRGFYDGEHLIIDESDLSTRWESIEDNYILSKREKELIKKLPVNTLQALNVGYRYEMKLLYNEGDDFIKACKIKETEEKPYKNYILNDYRLYKQNTKIICNKPLGKEQIIYSYSEKDILENAIKTGAFCKTVNLKASVSAKKLANIQFYIDKSKISENADNKDYFLILKGINDFSELPADLFSLLNPIMHEIENYCLYIFFESDDENVSSFEESIVPKFSINDEDFYHKQEQLKIWLKHEAFADWKTINDKCEGLLEPFDENIRSQYGRNPIYRLFYPLVINGDAEVCKKDELYGFCIPPTKVSLDDKVLCYRKAIEILKSFPSLTDYIKTWAEDSSFDLNEYVYPQNIFGFLRRKDDEGKFVSRKVLSILQDKKHIMLFKTQACNSPHLDSYCALVDENDFIKVFILPRNMFEAKNIVNCAIEASKDSLFVYTKENKELKCKYDKYYGIIPTLVQRALILFDAEQLKDKSVYAPYRNYKSFMNVPEDAIKYLKNIFGEKSVEEM